MNKISKRLADGSLVGRDASARHCGIATKFRRARGVAPYKRIPTIKIKDFDSFSKP